VTFVLVGIMVFSIVSKDKTKISAQGSLDFSLESIDGKNYSISDFKGKKVILNFFATWCPPCNAEVADFERFYRENKDHIIIIGIDMQEDKKSVVEFVKSKGITYPVLLDADGKVSSRFNIGGIPTSFLLDENGNVISWNVGMMSYSQLKEFVNKK